ncbi:metal ABC transporter substrate-binding protein [Trueperella pyogenes]|uniref:metal ABC transporter substrate-binding protein n=1 Tax=Trueperella pyogenes TaxID=1661 RepID=UPI00131B9D44|nr:zinc ABC transporter substrate-binding protein [Trueperella pyogenes]
MRHKLLPLIFASALALSACTSTPNNAASSSAPADKLKVTTSFYPLTYLTEKIGGERVSVTDLTPPGTDAHGVELSPKEVAALSESDLVLYVAKLSPAIDDAIKASGVSALNIGDHVNLLPFDKLGGDPHGHGHTTTTPQNLQATITITTATTTITTATTTALMTHTSGPIPRA